MSRLFVRGKVACVAGVRKGRGGGDKERIGGKGTGRKKERLL